MIDLVLQKQNKEPSRPFWTGTRSTEVLEELFLPENEQGARRHTVPGLVVVLERLGHMRPQPATQPPAVVRLLYRLLRDAAPSSTKRLFSEFLPVERDVLDRVRRLDERTSRASARSYWRALASFEGAEVSGFWDELVAFREGVEPRPKASAPPSGARQPLSEKILARADKVSEEEWRNAPTDLALHFRRYKNNKE